MVEVSLGAGRVVQAQRTAHQPCETEELAVVRSWTVTNGLTSI